MKTNTVIVRPNVIDITGMRFNRLIALKYVGNKKWLFKCDCGNEKIIASGVVKAGTTKACGCLRSERHIGRLTHRKLYDTWQSMRQRCNNKKNKAYKNYGGRGIAVSAEWNKSFEAFFNDMGERPKSLTLERIDNDKGYSRANCKWASRKDQCSNRRPQEIGVTNTTGYKNVSFDKANNRYATAVMAGGARVFLKASKCKHEAAMIVDMYKEEMGIHPYKGVYNAS